jgi:dihydrofolate reductase
MKISIIVAAAENGVIGRGGELPWHLPDDLKTFKRLTVGHPVIMGRRTFQSIGRPLPDRQNLVLSRSASLAAGMGEGVEVVDSFAAALERAHGDEVFVIGGRALFEHALDLADRVYLTLVHARVDGDVHFPVERLEREEWSLESEEHHAADERHVHAFSFRVYRRG